MQYIVSKQQVALERTLTFVCLLLAYSVQGHLSIPQIFNPQYMDLKSILFCDISGGNCKLFDNREHTYPLHFCIPYA